MGIFDFIEQKILSLLAPILGPIRGLVGIFTHLKDNTIGILDAGTKLVQSIESTYEKIRHFSTAPKLKTRVISVPRVAENLGILAQVPAQIIQAFRDLVEQLRTKLRPESFNVDEIEGLEDLRGIVRKLGSRIAAGFEKILGIVSLIVDALVTIRATINDLQTIVDSVATVVDDLSNLEGLFLPQTNRRKTLALEDGGKIKVRIGALHAE